MSLALVLDAPRPAPERPLRPTTRSGTEPAPGEVLIQVEACAVCRTDLQLVEGDLAARRLPVVPGHQIVGRVVASGEGVTAPGAGERVGVAWIAGTCGRCRFCRRGRENLCETASFTGWDRDGGFAELVTARADFTHPLPRGFAPVEAAPLLCGGAIGYRCLAAVEAGPGTRLGLYGFGASATCVIQVARHLGCDVYVCTRSAGERARALELGAVWAGGYEDRPPVPLDAAITFAPAGSVVLAALAAVDRGGRVVVNAIHLDHVPEFPYELLWWERELRSVANVTRHDVRGLLELAAAIPIRTRTEVFPLTSANDALAALAAGRLAGTAVLIP